MHGPEKDGDAPMTPKEFCNLAYSVLADENGIDETSWQEFVTLAEDYYPDDEEIRDLFADVEATDGRYYLSNKE